MKDVHFVVFAQMLVGHLKFLQAYGKQDAVEVHRVPRRKSGGKEFNNSFPFVFQWIAHPTFSVL